MTYMTLEDQLVFRIACALNMCEAFRAALAKNENLYTGMQVPNPQREQATFARQLGLA